jgi:hypothetical protein
MAAVLPLAQSGSGVENCVGLRLLHGGISGVIQPEVLDSDTQGTGKTLRSCFTRTGAVQLPSAQRVDSYPNTSSHGCLREGRRGQLGLLLADLTDPAHRPQLSSSLGKLRDESSTHFGGDREILGLVMNSKLVLVNLQNRAKECRGGRVAA